MPNWTPHNPRHKSNNENGLASGGLTQKASDVGIIGSGEGLPDEALLLDRVEERVGDEVTEDEINVLGTPRRRHRTRRERERVERLRQRKHLAHESYKGEERIVASEIEKNRKSFSNFWEFRRNLGFCFLCE